MAEISFSKKDKRQLTEFLARELLYDYACKQLDPERQKAVEEFLKNSKDVHSELESIHHGMSYSEALSKTVVSDPLMDELKMPSGYLDVLSRKINFSSWSSAARVGTEAGAIVLLVVLVVSLMPWNKLFKSTESMKGTFVISEVNKKSDVVNKETELAVVPDETKPKDEALYTDEELGTPTPAPTNVAATDAATKQKPPEQAATKEEAPAVPPTPSKAAESAPAASVATAAQTNTASTPTSAKGEPQGFLYRSYIKLSNIDVSTAKIRDKIIELGGRKAGGVELGWKKGKGSYFHFTIPEKNYDQLITLIEQYAGKGVKVKKDRHERVMPDGIIRFIIEAEPTQVETPVDQQDGDPMESTHGDSGGSEP